MPGGSPVTISCVLFIRQYTKENKNQLNGDTEHYIGWTRAHLNFNRNDSSTTAIGRTKGHYGIYVKKIQMLNSPSLTRGFEVCKELWKVSICKLGPLADFVLLLLGFGLVGNALDLCHCPPLCSVCSRFHSIFLEIFLNIEHVTGQFNFPEQIFDFIINLGDADSGIIWIGNVLLRVEI